MQHPKNLKVNIDKNYNPQVGMEASKYSEIKDNMGSKGGGDFFL